MQRTHLEKSKCRGEDSAALSPTVARCHEWIVSHQRIEFFVKILFIDMEVEVIFDEDILDEIWVAQVDGRIQNLVVAIVWHVRKSAIEIKKKNNNRQQINFTCQFNYSYRLMWQFESFTILFLKTCTYLYHFSQSKLICDVIVSVSSTLPKKKTGSGQRTPNRFQYV